MILTFDLCALLTGKKKGKKGKKGKEKGKKGNKRGRQVISTAAFKLRFTPIKLSPADELRFSMTEN